MRMTSLEVREILKYCMHHPKACVRVNNVVYAPKLFFVNSVLNSLDKKIKNKSLNNDTVDYYLECIVGYINEYYDLSFENDELRIVSHY